MNKYILAQRRLNTEGKLIKNARRSIIYKVIAESNGDARRLMEAYILSNGDNKHRYELLTGDWKVLNYYELRPYERNPEKKIKVSHPEDWEEV